MTILVTGATSGFGKAIAMIFAKNGYDVIITGRRKEKLEEVKAELEKFGKEVLALQFDVCSNEEVKAAVSKLTGKWANIDVLARARMHRCGDCYEMSA